MQKLFKEEEIMIFIDFIGLLLKLSPEIATVFILMAITLSIISRNVKWAIEYLLKLGLLYVIFISLLEI